MTSIEKNDSFIQQHLFEFHDGSCRKHSIYQARAISMISAVITLKITNAPRKIPRKLAEFVEKHFQKEEKSLETESSYQSSIGKPFKA